MYTSMSVMLYVRDLEASVNFYASQLGFGFKGYWDSVNQRVTAEFSQANDPAYAEVTFGDFRVALHVDREFVRTRSAFELQVGVKDVDALHAQFVAAQVPVRPPQDFPWGARMFSLTDPDGHVWNFSQPL